MLRRFFSFSNTTNCLLRTPVFYRSSSSRSKNHPPEPPSPELCCMSGCTNCVWLEYAKELKEYCKDNDKDVLDKALEKIEDSNFRSFIRIEIEGILSKPTK